MDISALLFDLSGTFEETVTGVHFDEYSGLVPITIHHSNRDYLCLNGQSYNNANPISPPWYRQVETQDL